MYLQSYWLKFGYFMSGFMMALGFVLLLFGLADWPRTDTRAIGLGILTAVSALVALANANRRWNAVDVRDR